MPPGQSSSAPVYRIFVNVRFKTVVPDRDATGFGSA